MVFKGFSFYAVSNRPGLTSRAFCLPLDYETDSTIYRRMSFGSIVGVLSSLEKKNLPIRSLQTSDRNRIIEITTSDAGTYRGDKHNSRKTRTEGFPTFGE